MVAVVLLSLLGTLCTVVWSTTASVAEDEAVAALLASKAEVAKVKLEVEEVRPRDHHRSSPVAPPLWDKSDPRERVLFLQYDTREFSSPLGSERPNKFKPCVSRQSKYDYKIGFWAQSALINQFYCDLHGFDYLYVVPTIGVPPSTARVGYHPSWWRTWVLPEVMRRYPTHRWIFVLDPDAFVEQVDLHLFDFLNQASVRPASFIAAFYSKDGAGAGEIVLRNDAAAIDLVEQLQTVVERGMCDGRYRQQINFEQTCLKYLFRSNASLHDSETVSKQPMGFMTDRFVRHCGGGGKQPCIDRGVYANALQRLSIDVDEAKVRWARIERDSLLRLEKPPEVWAEDYPVLSMG